MKVEEKAFEIVLAKLDSQRIDLQAMRAQASAVAAATALTAAFFGGWSQSALAEGAFYGDAFFGYSVPALLLASSIVGSIAFSLQAIVVRDDFNFSFDTAKILAKAGASRSQVELLESYVRDGEWFFQDNEKKLKRVQDRLFWASVLGWSQFFPWFFLLSEGKSG